MSLDIYQRLNNTLDDIIRRKMVRELYHGLGMQLRSALIGDLWEGLRVELNTELNGEIKSIL